MGNGQKQNKNAKNWPILLLLDQKNVITLLGKVNGHVINCFEAEESNDICF